MNWTQPGAWYIESEEGYRISKNGGDPPTYTAWAPRNEKGQLRPLKYTQHLMLAKKACEEHLGGDGEAIQD